MLLSICLANSLNTFNQRFQTMPMTFSQFCLNILTKLWLPWLQGPILLDLLRGYFMHWRPSVPILRWSCCLIWILSWQGKCSNNVNVNAVSHKPFISLRFELNHYLISEKILYHHKILSCIKVIAASSLILLQIIVFYIKYVGFLGLCKGWQTSFVFVFKSWPLVLLELQPMLARVRLSDILMWCIQGLSSISPWHTTMKLRWFMWHLSNFSICKSLNRLNLIILSSLSSSILSFFHHYQVALVAWVTLIGK